MRCPTALFSLLLAGLAACAQGTSSEPSPLPGAAGSAGQAGSAGEAGAADASAETGEQPDSGVPDTTLPDSLHDGPSPEGDAPSNPCQGVSCNTPPANECADAQNLKVHNNTGTCDQGTCQYASSLLPCPFGCAASVCTGDPCIGVTCQSPPAKFCSDATYLAVYDVPGSCSEGVCSYTTHEEFCKYGCESGVCNGDPCVGQSCSTPPASFCSGPQALTAYNVPGTCANGACTYTNHEEYCQFGCESGACKGDPCAGVSCVTPPASYCAGPATLRTFSPSGACKLGACEYPSDDVPCVHGCTNGTCKDCVVSSDCASGKWCNSGTCAPCDADTHCGASCADCAAAAKVCKAGTTCVACTLDSHCGPGAFCSADQCLPCNTGLHCGSGCVPCPSATPDCSAGACVCSAGSCPQNQQCVAGACSLCSTDQACGASCTPCAAPTPRCFAQASSSQCVECLSDPDCASGKVCNASHACVDAGCPPPADSCTTGSQNRSGCSNARVIGRKAAMTSTGYKLTDTTCYANDKFDDSSGCWDANSDHAYRLYLRKGETATIDMVSGSACGNSWPSWNMTLQLWGNAGCADLSCTTKLACQYNNYKQNKVFVAPADGWYIIVVDGSSAFDDSGAYTLTVKLTCNVPGCECP